MSYEVRRVVALAAVCLFGFVATTASAQTKTTSTETKRFEIISVDGNTLVVRGVEGTREITVPEDFKLTVNGKPMSVSELKPGMKGTATITTTTVTKPVIVTEVKNGTVMQASGASVLVRTETGMKMFSPGDIEKRGVRIMKDGQVVDLSALHAGDKLTATIVTEKPPQVMTSRQVEATLTPAEKAAVAATTGSAGAGAASGSARAGSASAAATTGTSAEPKKTLPKTASQLPLVALMGFCFCGLGLVFTLRRRWEARQNV